LGREGDHNELEDGKPCVGLKMLRLERFLDRIDSRNEGLDGVEGGSLSVVVVVWDVLLPEIYVSPEERLGRGGV
jgi:hypothetical protein